MAICMKRNCANCGWPFNSIESGSGAPPILYCRECRIKHENVEKERWLVSRAALSMDERLELLESWMYDCKKQRGNYPPDLW